MTKPARVAISRTVRECVLAEFRHRCALCGGDRPHVHHIDEDRTNNDPVNLLPLCPNCHVRDQHDPTVQIVADVLRLFRRYRDPMILHPGFKPVWKRCRFSSTWTSIRSRSSIASP